MNPYSPSNCTPCVPFQQGEWSGYQCGMPMDPANVVPQRYFSTLCPAVCPTGADVPETTAASNEEATGALVASGAACRGFPYGYPFGQRYPYHYPLAARQSAGPNYPWYW